MRITSAKDVEACIEQQVRAGICRDAGDFVNEVLRGVRQQQEPSFEPSADLET